jgi:hypothetical protein
MTGALDVARIEDAEAGFAIEIPEAAASGAPVEVERDERDGTRRLHAQTPDGSEVYVEVLAGAAVVDHGVAIAEQGAFLRERATVERLTDSAPAVLGGRPASTFDFVGELGGRHRSRRFAFVDAGGRTYRIVHDPTSPANELIIRTLRLPGEP